MSAEPLRPPDPAREQVPRFRDAVKGDLAEIARVKEAPWPSIATTIDVLALPGTWAVIVFRIGSTLHHRGIRPLSRICYFMNIVLFGAETHCAAIVQPGLVLPHPNGVAFGGGVRMGKRVKLMRGTGMGGLGNPKRPGMPWIGDDVWLLDSAKVLGPAIVGDRTMIGADATVVDDIPADMFVFGPRKSTEMRPLGDMGVGVEAERDEGYGIAGRNDQRTADPVEPSSEPASGSGARRPLAGLRLQADQSAALAAAGQVSGAPMSSNGNGSSSNGSAGGNGNGG